MKKDNPIFARYNNLHQFNAIIYNNLGKVKPLYTRVLICVKLNFIKKRFKIKGNGIYKTRA